MKPDLVDALAQLSFEVQAILTRLAAPHDLSLIQVRLLGVLRDREPAMNTLAAHLALDKSSVSGLVDRAERRGLVKRSVHEDDRRSVRVALTAKGRALAQAFTAQMEAELERFTRTLPQTARAQLAELVNRLLAANAR